MNAVASEPVAVKKLRKLREKLMSTFDPEDRAYLENQKRKLESILAPRTPTKSIPKDALRLRHKYHL